MFKTRTVALAAGEEMAYDETEWSDQLVLVKQGAVELEAHSGVRWCFRRGSVISLAGLPLRALHNRGPGSAVLLAVARDRRMVTP